MIILSFIIMSVGMVLILIALLFNDSAQKDCDFDKLEPSKFMIAGECFFLIGGIIGVLGIIFFII